MNEILHANIFFVIASLATAVFIILISILLYHVIKIARAISRIVQRVEKGSEAVASDIEDLRANLNPAKLFGFVMNIIPTPRGGRRRDYEDNE